jgi:hypothetical protein
LNSLQLQASAWVRRGSLCVRCAGKSGRRCCRRSGRFPVAQRVSRGRGWKPAGDLGDFALDDPAVRFRRPRFGVGLLMTEVRAALHRSSLDAALARRANPCESPALARRAARLTSRRSRRKLAASVDGVLAAAARPGPGLSSAVQPSRDEVAVGGASDRDQGLAAIGRACLRSRRCDGRESAAGRRQPALLTRAARSAQARARADPSCPRGAGPRREQLASPHATTDSRRFTLIVASLDGRREHNDRWPARWLRL